VSEQIHPVGVGHLDVETIGHMETPVPALVELEEDGTDLDVGLSNREFVTEKRGKLGVAFWIFSGYIGLNAFAAIFAPVLPIQDPNAFNFNNVNSGPTAANWFGTDESGRDIFSRIIWGARTSLTIGVSAMILAYAIGATIGMFAAYRRGKLDMATSSGMFIIQAFPGLILLIAITQFWTPKTLPKLIVAIAFVAIPLVFRVMRGSTISYATREYVTAAKMQGARDGRILLRELLPNIAPTAVSFFLIGIALVIALEGALSFLGLSVTGIPSWGNMIAEAQQDVKPFWLLLFASGAFCLFLFSLNFVGDRLRSYFDVSEIKL
jgi:peptide/nickel transport system permease protein